jgi:hypothetical protein
MSPNAFRNMFESDKCVSTAIYRYLPYNKDTEVQVAIIVLRNFLGMTKQINTVKHEFL